MGVRKKQEILVENFDHLRDLAADFESRIRNYWKEINMFDLSGYGNG